MTRVVSVGRSKGVYAIGALGFALLTLTLVGCPGTLDNPGAFTTGGAGSSGSAGAGTAGGGAGMAMAGASGSAGTGGLPPGCDPMKLFTQTGVHDCTLAGACHDAMGSGAGFKMAGTGGRPIWSASSR